MKDDSTPSLTAAYVAAMRGLAQYLPPSVASLASDPYGLPLCGRTARLFDKVLSAPPLRLGRMLFASSPTATGVGKDSRPSESEQLSSYELYCHRAGTAAVGPCSCAPTRR